MNVDTEGRFDESAWRLACEAAANAAAARCGLSHDLYVEQFSGAIDALVARLPEESREQALATAQAWDYATPPERKRTQKKLAEAGLCLHGIDKNCCPAGCGE